MLASGSADSTIKLWDAATGQGLATLKGHSGSLTSLAFSPDGKTLASASADNAGADHAIKLWALPSFPELQKARQRLPQDQKRVTKSATAPRTETSTAGQEPAPPKKNAAEEQTIRALISELSHDAFKKREDAGAGAPS
jgi:WD40 repeat protein